MNIFERATVRLTLSYLALMMLLAVIFSVVIYQLATRELDAVEHRQEMLLTQRGTPAWYQDIAEQRLEEVQQGKANVALQLVWFNLIVVGVGGVVSYILARRTLEPIEEAHEAQRRFTADASHELRTPLTAIRSEIEVALRDKKLTLADSRQLHESALEEVGKLEHLVNSLLQLARQDGESALSLSPVEIAPVLSEALKAVQPQAKERSITIVLPEVTPQVIAHAGALQELCIILLDNAVKYSPDGTTVTVSVKEKSKYAEITVRDEGVGIPAADLQHIFRRFYRASLSRTKQGVTGFGLGLSIADRLVKAMHGSISAQSEEGKGSVFMVRLPLAGK